jgi:hypothetical protein
VNALAFSPNDALLATGSQDKSIKLWKLPSLVLHATLRGHKRGVWDLAFSPVDQVNIRGEICDAVAASIMWQCFKKFHACCMFVAIKCSSKGIQRSRSGEHSTDFGGAVL